MLQNVRVLALTVSELLRENQQGGGGRGGKINPPPPPTKIRVKYYSMKVPKNWLTL